MRREKNRDRENEISETNIYQGTSLELKEKEREMFTQAEGPALNLTGTWFRLRSNYPNANLSLLSLNAFITKNRFFLPNLVK